MKTIFLTLSTSTETKNLMRSDFREEMTKAGTKLVLFVPQEKKGLYTTFFGNDLTIVEGIADIERSPSRWKKMFRSIAYASIPTETIWVRQRYTLLDNHNYAAFAWKRALWYLGHLRLPRAIIRWVEYHVFRDDHLWDAFFDQYKPDAVFGTNVIHDVSISLMKAARRRGIPDVGMMKSWDNLSSKGLLRFHPSLLLVNNEIMRGEAMKWNDFPSSQIRVIGIPQYDHYRDPSLLLSREAFCTMMGLDPQKKIVTYFGGGLLTGVLRADDPTDHVTMLNKAIDKQQLPDINILLRTHPKDVFDEAKMATLTHVRVYKPGKKLEGMAHDWEFNENDIKILVSTIYWSDVTINTGSTMSLEAAIFDKPVILTGFNGYHPVPWQKDIGVALTHTTHYQYVERTGGTWRAKTEAELIEAVHTYLAQPSLHREGRARLIQDIVDEIGSSGKKTAAAVQSVL